ncbi:MAG: hypothetical protein ACRCYO_17185, partial [Bacteroidia bacterium]
SCSSKQVDVSSYVEWIDDPAHGLVLQKSIGDIQYSLQYKPLDFVLLQHLQGAQVDADSLKRLRVSYSGMEYFTFRIRSQASSDVLGAGLADEAAKNQRLQYFMDGIRQDFLLVCGGDTFPAVLCHYERDYGISPFQTFSLGFETTKLKNEDWLFIYQDQAMQTGTVQFRFKADDLNHLPNPNL